MKWGDSFGCGKDSGPIDMASLGITEGHFYPDVPVSFISCRLIEVFSPHSSRIEVINSEYLCSKQNVRGQAFKWQSELSLHRSPGLPEAAREAQ